MIKLKILNQKIYEENINTYWSAISRVANFLMATNIAIFVTSKLIFEGYYFTFISLGCLVLVHLMSLFPTVCFKKLWYYKIALGLFIIALYFFIASVIYWLQNTNEVL